MIIVKLLGNRVNCNQTIKLLLQYFQKHLKLYKSYKKLILDKTPAIQTRTETTWMFGDFNNASFFNIKERLNFSFTIICLTISLFTILTAS